MLIDILLEHQKLVIFGAVVSLLVYLIVYYQLSKRRTFSDDKEYWFLTAAIYLIGISGLLLSIIFLPALFTSTKKDSLAEGSWLVSEFFSLYMTVVIVVSSILTTVLWAYEVKHEVFIYLVKILYVVLSLISIYWLVAGSVFLAMGPIG